ncbi:MAG TPA: aminotransferase class I/II-fold pyridoxal phosphate-dependent enzyme [Xanthobacteraceae bacterium]|nr:aminotransferase class I/II-fold pyridoxal phosphate-dependent enzyme [Xanthobacteraceae bacterium]
MTTPRLATLDQLNRVIYARSFSKTLSGSLRVGFIACRQDMASELADIKMLTSITTSQFTERLIYLMLVDGHYRKYLSRLHERLGDARLNVMRAFERIGLEIFVEPADGMFVWARFPHVDDSLALAEDSKRDGIMLAPGAIFRPHLEPSPWMRFNVAVCEDTRVQRWLQKQMQSRAAAEWKDSAPCEKRSVRSPWPA